MAVSFVLAAAMAGCSWTSTDPNEGKTEEEIALDSLNDNADERIDMSKVEGTDAQTADDSSAKGEVGDTVVEITDAKVIQYNEQDVIVVSYEFTNNTGEITTFNTVENSAAYQNEQNLGLATVVGVDGIECDTLGQRVEDGETITVQKAFRLANLTDDVTVTVNTSSAISESAPVSKVFKISE